MTDSKWKRSGTWIYIERRDRVVQQSLVAKMCYLGSIGEQEQLADFIVCACNAHDDLLTACEAAYDQLIGIHDGGYGQHKNNPIPVQLRAAIAKAKGETS